MPKMNLYFQRVLITQAMIGILGTFRKIDGRRDESTFDSMTVPLKADPLCYNKAPWTKRYETHIICQLGRQQKSISSGC